MSDDQQNQPNEQPEVIELSEDEEEVLPPPRRPASRKATKRESSSPEVSSTDKRAHVVVSSDSDIEEEQQDAHDNSHNSDESNQLPADFPPVEICIERCRRFAELTGTDESLAQFFLQFREWDLERSVAEYFQELEERNAPGPSRQPDAAEQGPAQPAGDEEVVVVSDSEEDIPNRDEPGEGDVNNLLKVISWNIDGLDPKNIDLRTRYICTVVKKAQADVAMFQEVIPETLAIIKSLLSNEFHILDSGIADYFTIILIHKSRLSVVQDKIFEFSNSTMGRKLQAVELIFRNRHKLFVMTTHLESTAEHTDARKVQLQKCFRNLGKITDDYSAILAGDLNLRDKEVAAVGGLPAGVVDVWEDQGCRPEAKFTWDMQRNDNLIWNARFKPKCRFDRMYFKESEKQTTILRASYFGLIGLERLRPHTCFPSDHWGLYAHFRLYNR